MVELLAPAGNIESLEAAIGEGADAVYLGGNLFGLRANAVNFTLEEIKEGVIYAHNLNKKLYVTVNIVFHNEDYKGLITYLKTLSKFKVDDIIRVYGEVKSELIKLQELGVITKDPKFVPEYQIISFVECS